MLRNTFYIIWPNYFHRYIFFLERINKCFTLFHFHLYILYLVKFSNIHIFFVTISFSTSVHKSESISGRQQAQEDQWLHRFCITTWWRRQSMRRAALVWSSSCFSLHNSGAEIQFKECSGKFVQISVWSRIYMLMNMAKTYSSSAPPLYQYLLMW